MQQTCIQSRVHCLLQGSESFQSIHFNRYCQAGRVGYTKNQQPVEMEKYRDTWQVKEPCQLMM